MLRREVEGNKIKSRASHIPGGGALLHGGWSRSRGWQPRAPEEPGTQGSRGALEPARTSGHHGRQAGRGRRPHGYLRPPLALALLHIRGGGARGLGRAGDGGKQHPEEGPAQRLPRAPGAT